jgi:hypothetical protein
MEKCERKVRLPGRLWCNRPGLFTVRTKGPLRQQFVMCTECREASRAAGWTVEVIGAPALKVAG